ncbi:MAG: hypothetical protein ACTSQP_06690 [Promethearchaeota archaeon]
MKFCPNCSNILLPKNGKLYCKACNEEFELKKTDQKEFKIVKTIKHDDKEITPIIVKNGFKGDKISAQDRKAFEEFFTGLEESGGD